MIIVEVLVRPLVDRLLGKVPHPISPGVALFRPPCHRNLASTPGREDFIRVHLRSEGETVWAEPVLGKSGLISTMVKAEGLLRIPLNTEGLEKGEKVEVLLFDC